MTTVNKMTKVVIYIVLLLHSFLPVVCGKKDVTDQNNSVACSLDSSWVSEELDCFEVTRNTPSSERYLEVTAGFLSSEEMFYTSDTIWTLTMLSSMNDKGSGAVDITTMDPVLCEQMMAMTCAYSSGRNKSVPVHILLSTSVFGDITAVYWRLKTNDNHSICSRTRSYTEVRIKSAVTSLKTSGPNITSVLTHHNCVLFIVQIVDENAVTTTSSELLLQPTSVLSMLTINLTKVVSESTVLSRIHQRTICLHRYLETMITFVGRSEDQMTACLHSGVENTISIEGPTRVNETTHSVSVLKELYASLEDHGAYQPLDSNKPAKISLLSDPLYGAARCTKQRFLVDDFTDIKTNTHLPCHRRASPRFASLELHKSVVDILYLSILFIYCIYNYMCKKRNDDYKCKSSEKKIFFRDRKRHSEYARITSKDGYPLSTTIPAPWYSKHNPNNILHDIIHHPWTFTLRRTTNGNSHVLTPSRQYVHNRCLISTSVLCPVCENLVNDHHENLVHSSHPRKTGQNSDSSKEADSHTDSLEEGGLARLADQTTIQVCPVTPFLPDSMRNPSLDLAHVGYRLATLSALPPSVPVSRLRLADAGFFFRGETDEVTCYSCHVRHSGWRRDDIPLDVHRRLSPSCQHLLHIDDAANGATVSTATSATTGPLTNSDVTDAPESGAGRAGMDNHEHEARTSADTHVEDGGSSHLTVNSEHGTHLANAESSNHRRPNHDTASISPARRLEHNSATSSASRTDSSSARHNPDSQSTPTSANSNNGFGDRNGAVTQASATSSHASREATISGAVGGVSDTSDTPARSLFPRAGLELGGAVYPMYQNMITRRHTFNTWDETRAPPLDDVILSGMFYAGYSDCVRCFYCGVGLKNWVVTDDVWAEHVRWRPECQYLRAVKGDNFIRDTQRRLGIDTDNSGRPEDGNRNSGAPSSTAGDRQPPAMSSTNMPPVASTATGNHATSSAAATTTTTSSSVNHVQVAASTSGSQGSGAWSSTLASSQPTRHGASATGASTFLSAADDNSTRNDNGSSSSSNSTSNSGRNNDSRSSGNNSNSGSTVESASRGAMGGARATESFNEAVERERLARLQAENRTLTRRLQCRICHQAAINTIFMPCGHLVVCEGCAGTVTSCPHCGSVIRATARVHMT